MHDGLELDTEVVDLRNPGGELVKEREGCRRFSLPLECRHDEKLPLEQQVDGATVIRIVGDLGSSEWMGSLQFTRDKQRDSGDHLQKEELVSDFQTINMLTWMSCFNTFWKDRKRSMRATASRKTSPSQFSSRATS